MELEAFAVIPSQEVKLPLLPSPLSAPARSLCSLRNAERSGGKGPGSRAGWGALTHTSPLLPLAGVWM